MPPVRRVHQRFNIGSSREYLDFVRQLIEIVNQGTFFLLCASCPLQDMFNTPIPGDTISHDFQRLMCGTLISPFCRYLSWQRKLESG